MLEKQAADDLFEKSSMTFGEHLEELRRCLVKSLLWLGIGTALGLVFAEKIVLFVERPLKLAIYDFQVEQAKRLYNEANGEQPSEELSQYMMTEGMMPERVFVDPSSLLGLNSSPKSAEVSAESSGPIDIGTSENGAAAATETAETAEPDGQPKPADEPIPAALPDDAPAAAGDEPTKAKQAVDSPQSTASEGDSGIAPIDSGETDQAMTADEKLAEMDGNPWRGIDMSQLRRLKPLLLWRPIESNLVSLTPVEGFMIWLKAGLVAGFVIGSPGIFFHIWQFFAAGLYPHERRYVYWYLPLSLALFLAGISLAFFFVFRLVLGFLMNYTSGLDVEFTPRLNDYMSFALFLPLGFGIAFQLPIVMLGLNRFGIIPVELYISQWRLAVLAIAFLSMLLTPAEIYSMVGLFIPLTGLYFLGIFLCKWMPLGAGVGAPPMDPE